jgi:hypothetical protein
VTANFTLTSSNSYSGKVNASCDAKALSGTNCTLSPANPITVASGGTANLTATINTPSNAATGNYNINISTQDTTGVPSHTFSVSLTVGQDFLPLSSTASQTVNAGQSSGSYNLTIQPTGPSFNGAVTLSCSGFPSYSQCMFNPAAPVTPGNSSANVVMTISTTAATTVSRWAGGRSIFYAVSLLLPGIALSRGRGARGSKKRNLWVPGSIATFLLLMLTLPACGGVSSAGGGGGGHPGTPPGTYKITVTGASSGTPPDACQSVQVTLVVH